jgi:Protein of unknown function (DUF2637)
MTLDMDTDHQVFGTTAHPRPRVDSAVAGPRPNEDRSRAADEDLTRLRRMQWAVRATLALGVAASVCANVLHARHDPIAQTIAGWPPMALMLTVELISRVPMYRRALAVLRVLATVCIAGIAAYVSYFHMAAVVSRYGEHQPNPYLLPISVDGLIVVASVSLVELAGRIRAVRDHPAVPHRADPPTQDEPAHQAVDATPAEALATRARSNGHASGATRPFGTPPAEPPPITTAAPLPPGTAPVPVEPTGSCTIGPPSSPVATAPAAELPTEPPADYDDDPDEDRDDGIDPELAALLPAARTARDALQRAGRGLTRDSLAAQLRRDGHTIRTSRVSALLNLLRNDEPATVNGRRTS